MSEITAEYVLKTLDTLAATNIGMFSTYPDLCTLYFVSSAIANQNEIPMDECLREYPLFKFLSESWTVVSQQIGYISSEFDQ